MYNHNKAQQSKNRVHISWDILYVFIRLFCCHQCPLCHILYHTGTDRGHVHLLVWSISLRCPAFLLVEQELNDHFLFYRHSGLLLKVHLGFRWDIMKFQLASFLVAIFDYVTISNVLVQKQWAHQCLSIYSSRMILFTNNTLLRNVRIYKWVIKFDCLFQTVDSEVHIVHISHQNIQANVDIS